jgi:putative ABC transport system ATP-binding protein
LLTAEARPVIELEHIHKTYTMGDVEVHALRGVSLTIREGESSQSWARPIRQIDDDEYYRLVDRPTKGSYVLMEKTYQRCRRMNALISAAKLDLCFRLQSSFANVSFGERRIADALSRRGCCTATSTCNGGVGCGWLAGREQNHPNQLSGGQQQRVMIARSLVNSRR